MTEDELQRLEDENNTNYLDAEDSGRLIDEVRRLKAGRGGLEVERDDLRLEIERLRAERDALLDAARELLGTVNAAVVGPVEYATQRRMRRLIEAIDGKAT